MSNVAIVSAIKQGLNAIGKITEIPSPFASVIRKITECVGPSLAFFGNCQSQWQEAAKPFVGAVDAIDLFEIIADANYFINGGFAKDRAKKRYFSIAAFIALTPADVITVMLYLKDAFKLSFQRLSAFAASVGKIPVFGLVARVSLVTAARTLVAAAFAFCAIDAYYRRTKYQKKLEHYEKELKRRNIQVMPSDQDLRELFKRAQISDRTQQEELGRNFIKFKSNAIKIKQAKLDFFAALSEVAIKVAVLGGLTAGATFFGSLVLAMLGAIAFGCVGYKIYYRLTAQKPLLETVL